jgi:MarR family 2-MHQ and catechol resistance regulon transcriptional repressor
VSHGLYGAQEAEGGFDGTRVRYCWGSLLKRYESFLDVKHLYIKMNGAGRTATEEKDDLSGIHIWLVLWKASRAVEAQAIRSVTRFGVVQSDFGVLEALLHLGPLSAKRLGEKVLLTSGSVTAAIDRLAARGLVRREDDAHDRRACIVQLTAPGRRLIEQAFAQHRAEMEEALAGFPVEDRRTLLPLLRRLGRTAEAKSSNAAAENAPGTKARGARRSSR